MFAISLNSMFLRKIIMFYSVGNRGEQAWFPWLRCRAESLVGAVVTVQCLASGTGSEHTLHQARSV